MESILLSDTHMGIKNSNKMWLDLTYNLFVDIVKCCNKNNINKIIHLGDWFHTRYSINVLSVECSYKIMDLLEKNNIHMYICKGNHDQYYKNKPKPHSLMIFEKYDNITIIDEPMEFDDEIICPWNTIPNETNKKILLGHYEINNIITNASGYTLTNSKLSIKDFKHFDKVYSGHFHTNSITKNIQYIGSAFPMDMNDINDARGYYHYKEGKLLDFIEYVKAPKFIKFTSEDDFDKIKITNNICKLIFIKSYSEKESNNIVEQINQYNPKELYIDFNIEETDIIDDSIIGTNSEIIHHYIKNIYQIPKGLNVNILNGYVEKLEKEIV